MAYRSPTLKFTGETYKVGVSDAIKDKIARLAAVLPLIAHFLDEYNVDENLLRRDIEEFLTKLRLAKMLIE